MSLIRRPLFLWAAVASVSKEAQDNVHVHLSFILLIQETVKSVLMVHIKLIF